MTMMLVVASLALAPASSDPCAAARTFLKDLRTEVEVARGDNRRPPARLVELDARLAAFRRTEDCRSLALLQATVAAELRVALALAELAPWEGLKAGHGTTRTPAKMAPPRSPDGSSGRTTTPTGDHAKGGAAAGARSRRTASAPAPNKGGQGPGSVQATLQALAMELRAFLDGPGRPGLSAVPVGERELFFSALTRYLAILSLPRVPRASLEEAGQVLVRAGCGLAGEQCRALDANGLREAATLLSILAGAGAERWSSITDPTDLAGLEQLPERLRAALTAPTPAERAARLIGYFQDLTAAGKAAEREHLAAATAIATRQSAREALESVAQSRIVHIAIVSEASGDIGTCTNTEIGDGFFRELFAVKPHRSELYRPAARWRSRVPDVLIKLLPSHSSLVPACAGPEACLDVQLGVLCTSLEEDERGLWPGCKNSFERQVFRAPDCKGSGARQVASSMQELVQRVATRARVEYGFTDYFVGSARVLHPDAIERKCCSPDLSTPVSAGALRRGLVLPPEAHQPLGGFRPLFRKALEDFGGLGGSLNLKEPSAGGAPPDQLHLAWRPRGASATVFGFELRGPNGTSTLLGAEYEIKAEADALAKSGCDETEPRGRAVCYTLASAFAREVVRYYVERGFVALAEPEAPAGPPTGLRLLRTSTAFVNAGLPLLLDRSPRNDGYGVVLAGVDTLTLGTTAFLLLRARQRREDFERGTVSSLRPADRMYAGAIGATLTYLAVKVAGLVAGYWLQEDIP